MHRFPRLLTCALAACVPVLGVTVALGPAASASSAPAAHSAQALAIAKSALRHLHVGQHATNHATSRTRDIRGGSTTSTNWAGYADISETYTEISGNWTEPSGTCSGSTTSLAAFWVGLDGFTSSSVEQDGTLMECYSGTLYQFSWWEMYPTNSIQVVGQSVAAGDHIAASVTRTGTSYALKVTDSTHTANSFSKTETCSSCANSSAEWIAEAPSGGSGVYPLTNFHSWTETGATVKTATVSGVISTFPYDSINMTGSSGNKATTSGLNSTGNGFTVTWNRST